MADPLPRPDPAAIAGAPPPRAVLGFLLATMFLGAMGIGLVAPVMPFLVARFVDPDRVASFTTLLSAAYAAASFLAAPTLGVLSDRFGRKPILIVSLVGSVAGYVVFGLADACWILVVGRVIDGVTAGNFSAVLAAVGDCTRPGDRARIFGYVGATAGAGLIAGPAIGGALAQLGLAAPVYFAAAVTGANAIFGVIFMRETRGRAADPEPLTIGRLNPIAQLGVVLRMIELRPLLVVSMLFAAAIAMMSALVAVFAKDELGWSVAEVSVVFVLVGSCDIAVQGLLLGRLLRRLGERRAGVFGLGLAALGLFGLASIRVIGSAVGLVAGVAAFAIGEGIFTACLGSAISNTASPEHQGRVQGGNQSLQSAMQIAAPVIGGLLYARIDPAAPYLLAGCCVLISALLFARTRVRDTDASPALVTST
jgi:DHA1 family tetracycline resistance protein-like MFS transporter